jgi:IS5 family transposase
MQYATTGADNFGMKAHIEVDDEPGLVHTPVTSPARAHDGTQAPDLLHGQETEVFPDLGYFGVERFEEERASK